MAEQDEIDAALDAALDELDDEDDDDDEEPEAELAGLVEKVIDEEILAATVEAHSEEPEKKEDYPEVSNDSKHDKPTTAANPTVVEAKPEPVFIGPPRPPAAPTTPSCMDNDEDKFFAEMMAQVQTQFSNSGDCSGNANEPPEAFLERLMQEMQSQLQSDMQQQQQPAETAAAAASASSTKSSAESKTTKTKSKNGDKKKNTTSKKSSGVDQAISNLIEDMAKKSNVSEDDDDDDARDHDDGDGDEETAMLHQLIKGLGELGGLGESGGRGSGGSGSGDFLNNADAMIDGMMVQLMSKDLMYEPMKQVTDKFPQWLQERKTVLSPDEYAKREKQFECFRQLVHVYETEPNNNSKLVSLMQQVQEYGQPPAEIIQEIAPGLDLDPDGVPKFQFPGLGGGGTGGGPLPPGMNEEDCVVM